MILSLLLLTTFEARDNFWAAVELAKIGSSFKLS